MRILVVSYCFPPYNIIGAVRVGKTAKYLSYMGHDIKVLTAGNQNLDKSLPLEIPVSNVIYTKWLNINKPFDLLLGGHKSIFSSAELVGRKSGYLNILKKLFWGPYKNLLNIPDMYIGWYPYAMKAAANLINYWKPDVIFASGKPFTSLIIASSLAKKYKIPWIGELRDLWTDDPYYSFSRARKLLEERIEKYFLSSADGLVSVSQPLVDILKQKYKKETCVVLNGYDPCDYPKTPTVKSEKLEILYTGQIYEGKRDPSPLFQAVSRLKAKEKIVIKFYGKGLGGVRTLAQRYQVDECVEIHEPVPYIESLKLQSTADILLLLLWNDSRERGTYTGKIFEYIGARRPILAIGDMQSVAAELIVNNKLGVVMQNIAEINDQLEKWLIEKEKYKMISWSCVPENTLFFTRQEQTRVLEAFINNILKCKKTEAV